MPSAYIYPQTCREGGVYRLIVGGTARCRQVNLSPRCCVTASASVAASGGTAAHIRVGGGAAARTLSRAQPSKALWKHGQPRQGEFQQGESLVSPTPASSLLST